MTAKKEGGSGLSAYEGDPEGAAQSLDVLLDVAVKNVPESIQSCTPIAVKATAGLRKVGKKDSDEILAAVRKRLETKYPFPVISEEEGGVQVMEGVDEGVYAWITVNYLLGNIGSPQEQPTAAVLDLGGGSTQIVFEPKFDEPEELAEGEHRHELSFGGRKFILYQHSYLGYGLMEERKNVHRAVIDGMISGAASSSSSSTKSKSKQKALLKKPIVNPCLNPGTWRQVTDLDFDKDHALLGGETVTVNMTGPDATGTASALNAASCRGVIERTMDLDKPCDHKPCSFAGVHQPVFPRVFPSSNDVVLLSYFFDRADPLGMPSQFSVGELKALSQRVCAGPGPQDEEDEANVGGWKDFAAIEGALKELQDRPETCLDLSYMVSLLRTGYGMKIDRELRILKKIAGNELGWCLGASLPLLSKSSGWECKIKQTS
jgi:guanosine-diphosphatase